jgi:hypothetical protein
VRGERRDDRCANKEIMDLCSCSTYMYMYVINGNGLSRRDEFRDACARKARPGQARRMMDEEQ